MGWYAFGSLYLLGKFQILFGWLTCILFFKMFFVKLFK